MDFLCTALYHGPGLAAEAYAAAKVAKYADQDNFIPFILETKYADQDNFIPFIVDRYYRRVSPLSRHLAL